MCDCIRRRGINNAIPRRKKKTGAREFFRYIILSRTRRMKVTTAEPLGRVRGDCGRSENPVMVGWFGDYVKIDTGILFVYLFVALGHGL